MGDSNWQLNDPYRALAATPIDEAFNFGFHDLSFENNLKINSRNIVLVDDLMDEMSSI